MVDDRSSQPIPRPPSRFWTGAAVGAEVASIVAMTVVVIVHYANRPVVPDTNSPLPTISVSPSPSCIYAGAEQTAYQSLQADKLPPNANASQGATYLRLVASDARSWADALQPDDPLGAIHARRAADAWDSTASALGYNSPSDVASYSKQAAHEEQLALASTKSTNYCP